jgi:16S rRNA processing protein RimM
VAQLRNFDERDQATRLLGCEIAVSRDQLPELSTGEYYWTDLQGLRVENLDGVELGRISHLFETGANDVIVVQGEREHLIPYTWGIAVRKVDLAAGLMIVDWDPDF